MKVALVHDWLTGMRGGEKCLEVLCELFPDAPIYTLFHIKGSVSQVIERHRIVTSYLNAFPFSRSSYRYYLPLFPHAIRSFDLRGYDLVLSSSHCVAKGVRVSPGTCHISYLHTPMRYVWDQYENYFGRGRCSILIRLVMSTLRGRIQDWDVRSNKQVHAFIANSQNVAERIKRHYGREASVVHAPVEWQAFHTSDADEGFFLMVTAFAPYKQVALAIQAANRLNLSLKIIGQGQEGTQLQQQAGPTVEFLGWQSDAVVRAHYRTCRAVLFPGEEDFGIVPLEAMASGKPVIAYGKGGVLETVVPVNPLIPHEGATAPTGVFFYTQTVDALIQAIQVFEEHRNHFQAHDIRAHVEPFDRKHFKERLREEIMLNDEQYRQSRVC